MNFKQIKSLVTGNFRKMLAYTFLICVVIVSLLPFFWMLSSAFKDLSEIFSYPPTLIPENFTLNNIKMLFEKFPFGWNIFNSFFVATARTLGSLFFCTLAGFGFAKFNFKYKNVLFVILLGSMMIPPQSMVIPLFLVFKRLGWINTFAPLIIPRLADPFGIFFMRQYIGTIPDSLIEVAKIDGASDFKIFTKIIFPIVKPALATIGIIFFMRSWNRFLWPQIVLRTPEMQTLTVIINNMRGGLRVPYNLILAGSAISVLPLFVIFLFLQKYFISGITAGAIKE